MWRLVYLLLFFSCDQDNKEPFGRLFYSAPTFEYTDLPIPIFLDSLILNHKRDFEMVYESEIVRDLVGVDIDLQDTLNLDQYFQIKILHELFTSRSSYNDAVGHIWVIPYMWHWIDPNPRHEIVRNKESKNLDKIEPPDGYGRYKSFADLDRTPSIYLQDFFSGIDTYSSKECKSFSSFGWCSEREMSYAALLRMKGYAAKVVAKNGQSWTEVIAPLKNTEKKEQLCKFTIDNTFDKFHISTFSKSDYSTWQKLNGKSKTQKWYNEKAFSTTEHEKIENFIVKDSVPNHLEKQVVQFLNRKI